MNEIYIHEIFRKSQYQEKEAEHDTTQVFFTNPLPIMHRGYARLFLPSSNSFLTERRADLIEKAILLIIIISTVFFYFFFFFFCYHRNNMIPSRLLGEE